VLQSFQPDAARARHMRCTWEFRQTASESQVAAGGGFTTLTGQFTKHKHISAKRHAMFRRSVKLSPMSGAPNPGLERTAVDFALSVFVFFASSCIRSAVYSPSAARRLLADFNLSFSAFRCFLSRKRLASWAAP
jgi:hypothetical protein